MPIERIPGTIGRYKIVRKLGEGGMGCVYLAEHVDTGWERAVKTLQLDDADETDRERFIQEAQAVAALAHENIVKIHDLGFDDDEGYFVVMELLNGEDLLKHLERRGRLPWTEVCDYLRQIAAALECAHSREIIHRDIKPQNCLLCQDGRIKLIDFGIAKIANRSRAHTATGFVIGTAAYISPEQARCEPADARSDLYSLGVTAYQLLCGTIPFEGTPIEQLSAHIHQRPLPLRTRLPPGALPERFDRIVMKCMAKRASERFQTATELRTALETLAAVQGEPVQRRKQRLLVGLAGVMIILVLGLGSLLVVILGREPTQEPLELASSDEEVVPWPGMWPSLWIIPPVLPVLTPNPPEPASKLPEATTRPHCLANNWRFVEMYIDKGRKAKKIPIKDFVVGYRREGSVLHASLLDETLKGSRLEDIVQRAFARCVVHSDDPKSGQKRMNFK